MKDFIGLVDEIVAANGGEIVGKTRLQKTVYLLDTVGLNSNYSYDYLHYGPFSMQLARDAEDAVIFGKLKYEERPGHHLVPYSVFKTDKTPEARIGKLTLERAREYLQLLNKYSSIELEVAATITYFQGLKYSKEQSVDETKMRKPLKATQKCIDRALELLDNLNKSAKT
jgi:uncharacterized protein YwgA